MSKEKGKIERKRKGWQEKNGGQFLVFSIFFSVVSIPGVSIIDADGDGRIFSPFDSRPCYFGMRLRNAIISFSTCV